MTLVFDTSVLIEIQKKNPALIKRLEELRREHPASPKIPFIVYFEFLFGLRKKSMENREKAHAFLELFEVIHTTKNTAHNMALLKQRYELPLADIMIASQILETKGILVTKDKDFERIEEIEKIVL